MANPTTAEQCFQPRLPNEVANSLFWGFLAVSEITLYQRLIFMEVFGQLS